MKRILTFIILAAGISAAPAFGHHSGDLSILVFETLRGEKLEMAFHEEAEAGVTLPEEILVRICPDKAEPKNLLTLQQLLLLLRVTETEEELLFELN